MENHFLACTAIKCMRVPFSLLRKPMYKTYAKAPVGLHIPEFSWDYHYRLCVWKINQPTNEINKPRM